MGGTTLALQTIGRVPGRTQARTSSTVAAGLPPLAGVNLAILDAIIDPAAHARNVRDFLPQQIAVQGRRGRAKTTYK